MNFTEIFRIALNSLLINRLRSVLTTIGIIIGVGAVIGLVSLGRGVEDYIDAEFEALGSNVLTVSSSRPNSPTRTRIEPLTTVEARDLSNPGIAPSIAQIALRYDLRALVVAGSERTQVSVQGVSANYGEVRNWPTLLGSFIDEEQVDSAARVAVLGLDVVEVLFGQRNFDPVGQSVRINDRTFTVIGVLEERGGTFSSEDNVVLIPLETAQTRLDDARTRDGGYRVSQMLVEVRDENLVAASTREIETYLNDAHNIVFADEQDYSVSSSADILSTLTQITGTLTIFLVMIAGISLLVGGIGVMNIMLVSVTERTREIGLRKAVGAQQSDILMQFLVESVVLCLLGGFIGILLGAAGAQIATIVVPDLSVSVSGDAVILATGVSTFVGVFFGYYPARQAARLSPIDALRFE